MRTRAPLADRALAIAIVATGLAGPGRAQCGAELTPDSTLRYDFGIDPDDLAGATDDELLATLAVRPNDATLGRVAVARALLWPPVLAYRVVLEDGVARVPPESGTWRSGRRRHLRSGAPYDIVHWQDVDDGSFSLYFDPAGGRLCEIGFEN